MSEFQDLDRCFRRMHSINEAFNILSKKFEWGDHVFMNQSILLNVVHHYYNDIDKYKRDVNTEVADQHKKAAYVIKWISILKPIQIKDEEELTKKILFCNQILALRFGFGALGIDSNVISSNFYKHLIYLCAYSSNISGIQLASKMYVIEKAVKGEIP